MEVVRRWLDLILDHPECGQQFLSKRSTILIESIELLQQSSGPITLIGCRPSLSLVNQGCEAFERGSLIIS